MLREWIRGASFSILLSSVALFACNGNNDNGGGGNNPPPPDSTSLRLQPLTSALVAPVFLTAPPGDLIRLFVVERGGLIRIQTIDPISGAPSNNPLSTFLDIATLIRTDGERGLLGMAFDPDFAVNRRFFVFYTDLDGDLIVARYFATAGNPNVADASTATIIKTIEHSANNNHNGGMLAFGPIDRCLYVGTGDGGGSGDPNNNGQNSSTLLGKILRLDPNSNTGAACTNIVANPFASGGGAPEVWSFGLRNPWRFSFDRQTGALYIGDVGERQREEVDVAVVPDAGRGLNFGWNLMEGFLCFNPPSGCNTSGLTLPILDYTHDNGACSITGGYVYRGQLNPSVNGTYFYGDFCAGFVRSVQAVNGQLGPQFSWSLLSPGGQITSFGEDARGELYILTLGGSLFRIVAN